MFMRFLNPAPQDQENIHDDQFRADRRLSKGFIMAQFQQREPKSQKIENARDLQSKLYREIGISAVAAALRFTNQPDVRPSAIEVHPLPGILRGEDLAA